MGHARDRLHLTPEKEDVRERFESVMLHHKKGYKMNNTSSMKPGVYLIGIPQWARGTRVMDNITVIVDKETVIYAYHSSTEPIFTVVIDGISYRFNDSEVKIHRYP
jgi:hypothetical protein